MSELAHNVRKRLSRAALGTKTLEAGMSPEYISEKHTILREKATLERVLELTTVCRKSWLEVMHTQKNVADNIAGDAKVDGTFYPRAAEAAAAVNCIYGFACSPPQADGTISKIETHVRAYLSEVNTVVDKFVDVESGFAEVSRYQRKVGKLSDRTSRLERRVENTGGKSEAANKKAQRAEKVASRTRRNLTKLEGERAAYESKLNGVINDMKTSSAKYETVLQCAHTAFWLSQQEMLGEITRNSQPVHDYVSAVKDELVDLDVTLDVGEFDAGGTGTGTGMGTGTTDEGGSSVAAAGSMTTRSMTAGSITG